MDNRFYFVKFIDERDNDMFIERMHIVSIFILKSENEISVATPLGSIKFPLNQKNIDTIKSLTIFN